MNKYVDCGGHIVSDIMGNIFTCSQVGGVRIGSWTNWHRDGHSRTAAELLKMAHNVGVRAIGEEDGVVQGVVGDLILLRL